MFESMDLSSLLPRSNQTDEEPEEESCIPSLTWREKMIGFGSCFVLGYLLSFGSFFRLKDLILGNPLPFVIHATVGNIVSLCGSCFLVGPRAQSKKMFHKTRRIASYVYLGTLALTLLVAFIPFPGRKGFVLLLLMICQYGAITWYCLSYIPFARDAIISWCRRFVSDEE